MKAQAKSAGGGGSAPSPLYRDPTVIVGVLVFIGYLATSRIVDNLYPFSTFSMYSGESSDSASRIVAIEADGAAREVSEYAEWSCQEPLDLSREHEICGALPRYSSIPYIDRQIVDFLRSRGGERAAPLPGGVDVTLARRVFRFSDGPGPARVEDCPMARCKAVRRP